MAWELVYSCPRKALYYGTMSDISLDQVRQVKAKACSVFASYGRVLGVGVTRIGSSYALKVNLAEQPISAPPLEIDGVPIQVEVTGPITKRDVASNS